MDSSLSPPVDTSETNENQQKKNTPVAILQLKTNGVGSAI